MKKGTSPNYMIDSSHSKELRNITTTDIKACNVIYTFTANSESSRSAKHEQIIFSKLLGDCFTYIIPGILANTDSVHKPMVLHLYREMKKERMKEKKIGNSFSFNLNFIFF